MVLLSLNLSRFLSQRAELCAGGLSFQLQGPGVGLQGGLGSAGAESPSAASAAAATAFCLGMHAKQTAVSLQNRAKLAASWHAVSTEDTPVDGARVCCLGCTGALGNRGRSAAKSGAHHFGDR